MSSAPFDVPEELMTRLHDVNARLHEARLRVERAMDASENDHQKHLTEAEENFRKVKKELEEIDQAIRAALHSKPTDAGA